MSRRSPLTVTQSQIRAASRMTPGTSMWSEQPLAEKRDRYILVGGPPALLPTIPTFGYITSYGFTIPDPPEFPGVSVVSGCAIHTITGANANPTPPLGWSQVGGRYIGGSNRWSTGAYANVWAWGTAPNVRGGNLSWSWTSADRHKYGGGAVMYLYAEEVNWRGSWSTIEGASWSTSGAGALSGGNVTGHLTPGIPPGAKVGWQVGFINSVYTNLYGTAGVTGLAFGTVGGWFRGGYGSIADLTPFKTPLTGYANWNYFGAYGSPAYLSMAAGWFTS